MPSLYKQEVLYPQEILFIIVQEEESGEVLSWLLHLIRPQHLALSAVNIMLKMEASNLMQLKTSNSFIQLSQFSSVVLA